MKQMAAAGERAGSAKVVRVLLHSVECPIPHACPVLPRDGRPLSEWPNREQAIADITEGLLETIPAEVQNEWVYYRLPPPPR